MIMLQRSLSASSLLKQAAAAAQAQQSERRLDCPLIGRTTSDYVAFPFSSRRTSRENTSTLPSVSSSGLASPSTREKHTHFNEQVEQCIALEVKGEDDEEADSYTINDGNDSSSDDGPIMMKRTNSKRKIPIARKNTTPRNNFSTDIKTIATLPSTILKYRGDTPEPQETPMKHSNGFWSSGKLSPSPSQETLRPSKSSTRILLSDEDEDDDIDVEWQPPSAFAIRKDSMSANQNRLQTVLGSGSSSSLTGEPLFLRKALVSAGAIFSKAADAWNTAKDIAFLIQNRGMDMETGLKVNTGQEDPATLPHLSQDILHQSRIYTRQLFVVDNKKVDISDNNDSIYGNADKDWQPPDTLDHHSRDLDGNGSDKDTYHDFYSIVQRDIPDHQRETQEILTAPVLDPMKQALVDRVMGEFWLIFNQRWTSNINQCVSGLAGSSDGMSSSGPSTGITSSGAFQRKRQRNDEEDELGNGNDDNNDKKSRQPRRGPAPPKVLKESSRFACPFRKHNSRRYNIYNFRACALSHWETIARVK
jgi:hypothetical protein